MTIYLQSWLCVFSMYGMYILYQSHKGRWINRADSVGREEMWWGGFSPHHAVAKALETHFGLKCSPEDSRSSPAQCIFHMHHSCKQKVWRQRWLLLLELLLRHRGACRITQDPEWSPPVWNGTSKPQRQMQAENICSEIKYKWRREGRWLVLAYQKVHYYREIW